MKNKSLVVKTLTLITAVLSFIFFNRLRENRQKTQIISLESLGHHPQLPASPKILLESVDDNKPQIDDLKLIRGIGAKSEITLNDAGIFSYAQLSSITQEQLETILHNAGLRIVNCEGWREQAKILA